MAAKIWSSDRHPIDDHLVTHGEAMGRDVTATVRALVRCARYGVGSFGWSVSNPFRDVGTGVRRVTRPYPNVVWQSSISRGIGPDLGGHASKSYPAWTQGGHAHFSTAPRGGSPKTEKEEPTPNGNNHQAHRVNEQITARQVRLIHQTDASNESSSDDDDGDDDVEESSDDAQNSPNEQKPTHEVISTLVALRRAKQLGLDLVEVNARADPPVCRLMNYDTFRYAQKVKVRVGAFPNPTHTVCTYVVPEGRITSACLPVQGKLPRLPRPTRLTRPTIPPRLVNRKTLTLFWQPSTGAFG